MSIKIATPISTLFKDKEVIDRIITASDCLECRDLSVESLHANQELFHFEYELTQSWGNEEYAYLKKVFAMKNDLKLVSFHAARRCTGEKIENGVFLPEGEMLDRATLLENARQNVEWLRSNLDQNVHIAIENNNDQSTPAYEIVTDPDFLSEIVETLDIVFLFDIAHAHISAHNRGLRYEDYRSALPLSKAVQLHLCTPEIPENGDAQDIHEPPSEEILAEMAELIKIYSSIEYVTVEYYKEPEGLIQSLIDVRAFIEK